MDNTITHFENGIPIETYHGVIYWTNRNEGTFWFNTRINGRIIGFWGKTDFWTVSEQPRLIKFFTVEGENNDNTQR